MPDFNASSGGGEASPTNTLPPLTPPEGWALVWCDEFDGQAIDSSNWPYFSLTKTYFK
jgi:hypothetical protein